MRITISGKHLNITDAMRKMAQKKMAAERYLPRNRSDRHHVVERDRARRDHDPLTESCFAARRRPKTCKVSRNGGPQAGKADPSLSYTASVAAEGAFRGAAPIEEAEAGSARIVRTKRFNIKPQDIEEACRCGCWANFYVPICGNQRDQCTLPETGRQSGTIEPD